MASHVHLTQIKPRMCTQNPLIDRLSELPVRSNDAWKSGVWSTASRARWTIRVLCVHLRLDLRLAYLPRDPGSAPAVHHENKMAPTTESSRKQLVRTTMQRY
jgi:hypothetical protein